MKNRKLDRVVKFDEKSKDYPIRELLSGGRLSNKHWKCDEYLDQKKEGACVGFSWAHELAAIPYKIRVMNSTARTIYYAAQQWDQWEGTCVDIETECLTKQGWKKYN